MSAVPCARCRGATRKRPNVDQWRCLQERGRCGHSGRHWDGRPDRTLFVTITGPGDAEVESCSWYYLLRIGWLDLVVHRPTGGRALEDVPIVAPGSRHPFYPIPREEIGS